MSRLFVWFTKVHHVSTWKKLGKNLEKQWQKLIVTNFQKSIDKCIHLCIIIIIKQTTAHKGRKKGER